jgi:hypothetical protein
MQSSAQLPTRCLARGARSKIVIAGYAKHLFEKLVFVRLAILHTAQTRAFVTAAGTDASSMSSRGWWPRPEMGQERLELGNSLLMTLRASQQ